MNKKNFLKIGLAIVSALVLIYAGYLLHGYMDKQAQKAAKNTAAQFISAVEQGNNNAAYNLTSSALKKNESQDGFNKTIAGLKTDKPVFEAPEVYLKGDTMVYVQKVSGIPASDNGRTDAIYTLNIAKDGGKWKVGAVAIR